MSFLNTNTEIFRDNMAALQFLLSNNIVPEHKPCSCGETMRLSISIKNSKEAPIYRCLKNTCRRMLSLYSASVLTNTKLSLSYNLLLLNYYVHNIPNFCVNHFTEISESAYCLFKNKLYEIIKKSNETIKIGGRGRRVQVDETIIVRGRLIRIPSAAYDEMTNAIWLVGGIIEDNTDMFFLDNVPNRQISTLTELLRRRIEPGSILVTDGDPSYPGTARNLNLEHVIVPHVEGFTTPAGDHTNSIENLWGHLKIEMRSRYGVMKSNWNNFVHEFAFRKRYLQNRPRETYQRVFLEILNKIFN